MTTITTMAGTHCTTSRASATTPVVFVVDDDVSVRESLELLIETAGWEPRRSRPRRSFWLVRGPRFRAAWCSTSLCRT